MKKSLLTRILAFTGLASAMSGAPSAITSPPPLKSPKPRYHNAPPPPPRPVEDLFTLPLEVRGWNGSPPSNQRKKRKARRQAHSNGKRNAFVR